MNAPTHDLLDAQEGLFNESQRPKLPLGLILFGAASAAAVYFSVQGDYGAASAIAFLGVALRSGYRAGAATFVGLFVGGALALVTAVPLGKAVEPLLAGGLGTQGLANRLLSIGVVGAGTILILTIITRYAVRRLVGHQTRFQTWDRWIGLTCGGVQGSLLVLIMAGGAVVIEPLARDELLARPPQDHSTARLVSEQVVMAAESIQNGRLGPLVEAYNPFEHIGPLRSLEHGVEVLRSPQSLQAVAEHPAVEALYDQPAFQQTLQQVSEDPELHDVLTSGEPITRQTLSSLMQNPAVLRLLDDREFIHGLTRVLGEIDPQTLAAIAK